MSNLLQDIEKFLGRYDLASSTFGRLAVNDGKFVERIKAGGRCWPETEKRVRDFMRSYKSQKTKH